MKNNYENSITQRFELLRNTLKLSKSAFCEASKIKQQTYSEAIINQSDVRFSLLNAVKRAFPSVSSEWLLTGEGTMFTSKQSTSVNVIESTFGNHTIIANTVHQTSGAPSVALLQAELDRLREENKLLIETNAQLVSDNSDMAKKF